MIDALNNILAQIKEKVNEDDPEAVYEFTLNSGSSSVQGRRLVGNHSLLPEWYINSPVHANVPE